MKVLQSDPQAPGRRMCRRLGAGVAVLALALAAAAPTRANPELYRKATPSTALILRADGGWGTGFLVDAKERLVVTALHVVQTSTGVLDQVEVIFAQSRNGKPIREAAYYHQNHQKLALKGKVVYHSARRDMAIIQLDQLPGGLTPLPLAAEPAEPGEQVHVIGNSTRRHGG